MVYKFLSTFLHNIPRHLQHNCLLCRHSIHPQSAIFGLCHYCETSLPRIQHACRRCAIPLEITAGYCGQCLQKEPAFSATHCAVLYQGDIPKLIHQLKYQHDKAVNYLLADLFIQSLCTQSLCTQSLLIPSSATATFTMAFANIDMIIPVPMHKKRNLQRGNNQSTLLSLTISKKLQLPHNDQLLQRTQLTPTQQGLSAKQRRKNLDNVFELNQPVAGLRIAVVDDVITTGSTMNEIAKTLLRAGASEVVAWAIARTPKNEC